jgi:agmatine/peptidylarginine deiminase
LTIQDWIGIVAIALGQVGAVLAAVWKFSAWMSRIETKVDDVIAQRLENHEGRIQRLEENN